MVPAGVGDDLVDEIGSDHQHLARVRDAVVRRGPSVTAAAWGGLRLIAVRARWRMIRQPCTRRNGDRPRWTRRTSDHRRPTARAPERGGQGTSGAVAAARTPPRARARRCTATACRPRRTSTHCRRRRRRAAPPRPRPRSAARPTTRGAARPANGCSATGLRARAPRSAQGHPRLHEAILDEVASGRCPGGRRGRRPAVSSSGMSSLTSSAVPSARRTSFSAASQASASPG